MLALPPLAITTPHLKRVPRPHSFPIHPLATALTHRIVFTEDNSSFRVPGERPANATVLQLLRADLARKRSVRLVEHVLRRHLNALAEVFAREEQVESRRGDDDLYKVMVGISST